MKIHSALIRPLALAALVATAGAAQAALVTYNTQAAFLAATTAQGVDGYNGFSITGTTPSPITRTAGTYTYQAAAATSSFFGAGTTANPWLSTNLATDFILFSNFSPSISAIGGNFFGSNIAGAFLSGNIILEAIDTAGTLSTTLIAPGVSSFFGFVSTTSLVSLKVTSVQGAAPLWPTVDNLTLGQRLTQVPEPATLALVAFGLLAAAGARRRA